MIIPVSCVAIWTTWPALNTLVATLSSDRQAIEPEDWLADPPLLKQRRYLQQHLLSRNVYIPMSDIMVGVPPISTGLTPAETSLFMQKVCGPSTLYAWIPLRFRFPLLGELIWEWCWKPPVTKT